jgi:hypothetical protein
MPNEAGYSPRRIRYVYLHVGGRHLLPDVSRELRLLATWPPGSPMKVGSVGQFLGDRVFEPETSLGSCGITFSVDDDPGPGVLSYTSDGVREPGVTTGTHLPDLAGGAVTAKAGRST